MFLFCHLYALYVYNISSTDSLTYRCQKLKTVFILWEQSVLGNRNDRKINTGSIYPMKKQNLNGDILTESRSLQNLITFLHQSHEKYIKVYWGRHK